MVKTIYDVDSRLKYVKGLPVEYFKYHGEGNERMSGNNVCWVIC
jgi:hypothetical protein